MHSQQFQSSTISSSSMSSGGAPPCSVVSGASEGSNVVESSAVAPSSSTTVTRRTNLGAPYVPPPLTKPTSLGEVTTFAPFSAPSDVQLTMSGGAPPTPTLPVTPSPSSSTQNVGRVTTHYQQHMSHSAAPQQQQQQHISSMGRSAPRSSVADTAVSGNHTVVLMPSAQLPPAGATTLLTSTTTAPFAAASALPPLSAVHTAHNHHQRILQVPLLQVVWQRLSVLISLLLLQSLSQFVLEAYEGLISANVVVPLFLTMLVGAGGNAGNQAAVHAITGLVTGELKPHSFMRVIRREFAVGLISSSVIFVIGFLRVYVYFTNEEVQPTPVLSTVLGVSLSLFFIVLTSVVLGAALPFFLRAVRMDVEHAAPMIQVLMDIIGVCIACVVCSWFLPSALQAADGGAAPRPPTAGK